jgi:hypothetical protein
VRAIRDGKAVVAEGGRFAKVDVAANNGMERR